MLAGSIAVVLAILSSRLVGWSGQGANRATVQWTAVGRGWWWVLTAPMDQLLRCGGRRASSTDLVSSPR